MEQEDEKEGQDGEHQQQGQQVEEVKHRRASQLLASGQNIGGHPRSEDRFFAIRPKLQKIVDDNEEPLDLDVESNDPLTEQLALCVADTERLRERVRRREAIREAAVALLEWEMAEGVAEEERLQEQIARQHNREKVRARNMKKEIEKAKRERRDLADAQRQLEQELEELKAKVGDRQTRMEAGRLSMEKGGAQGRLREDDSMTSHRNCTLPSFVE